MMKALTGVLVVAALAACGQPQDSPAKEKPMPMMKSTPASRTGIPPIDAAVPARIETATFALG